MSIENIWVVFELADGAYGLGVAHIREWLPLTDVTRAPLARPLQ
jgi:chemotaxis signal transduction protein